MAAVRHDTGKFPVAHPDRLDSYVRGLAFGRFLSDAEQRPAETSCPMPKCCIYLPKRHRRNDSHFERPPHNGDRG